MASSSGVKEEWSLPDVIAYFQADSEIKDEVSEEEFNKIISVDSDWVKLVRAALEYQGFDPRVILSQLIRNRKSYESQKHMLVRWDLSNVGDDLKWTGTSIEKNKFSNQESISADVNFMITVFLARNNHIGKIIKKSRGGVDDILNMLKEKYVIDDDVHKSGTSLESRTITLPRIAGVFPGTAVRMFHEKSVKEIVTYELFPGSKKPATHAICCPLLPSVCPAALSSSTGNNFHPVMIWNAIKLDEIIHRKDKEVTPLIDLLGYYRAGYQSAAVPEKSRVTIFKNIGIVSTKKTSGSSGEIELDDNAKALVTSCLSALGGFRQDDENHDLMIRVAKTGDMTLF